MLTSAADAGKIKLKKQLNIKFALGALPESLKGVCLKHRLQYRYFDAVARYQENAHEVDRNLGMLSLFTRGELHLTERTLWILPSEREAARASLPSTHAPLVLISSSGSRPNQNWSSVLFASLCDRLIQERGATVVFVGKGGLAEKHTGEILDAMKRKAFSLVNKTTFGELSALVEMADVMISVDTGTAHLASYLNVPLVVIFGPGDLQQWGPWHQQQALGAALSVPCKCATPQPKCFEDRHCLDALEPGRVFDTAVKLINEAKDIEASN
jgi:ADP-heptose:LPS heptosyltransferase